MGATDPRRVIIADAQFGAGATGSAPATWFWALSTTVPANDGTGFTEPVGGSYARLSRTNNSTNFPAATTVGGLTNKTNGVAFTFANPTGLWGLIMYWGCFTASSGGTVQYWNPLTSNETRYVQSGNTPVEFPANTLILPWA